MAKNSESGYKSEASGDDVGDKPKKMTTGQLCREIERRMKYAVSRQRSWNKVAKEDIDFALGEQWDKDEIAQLTEQRRPVMTFNKIKPYIMLITGHMIQNSNRIEVSPEGGEDERFSQVADKLIDHLEKLSKYERNLSLAFAGGERAGRSWVGFDIDFDEDPIFGKLFSKYLGPFKVYMDPDGEEYDNSDCEYGFKVRNLTKGQLKTLFPKKEKVIDQLSESAEEDLDDDGVTTLEEGDANNYGNDKDSPQIGINEIDSEGASGVGKKFKTLEYWYKKRVKRYAVYYVDTGEMPMFETKDERDADIAERQQKLSAENVAAARAGLAPKPFTKFVLRERFIVEMWIAIKAGGKILAHGVSPFEPYYHGYSFFNFIAEYAPEASKPELRIQGLVRSMKDPQREVNKARSQFLHILNTCANSGWMGDDDALTEQRWSDLKQFGAVPGIIIRKTTGKQLDRIHPVEPSLAQQVREKAATDDFKEVTGVNADLLSVDSKSTPSGKALAMRIRQGITILTQSIENFLDTKRQIGEFLFSILPMLFDREKVKKVLGARFIESSKLTDADIDAFLIQIEDGKYNVKISQQGDKHTLREETFEDLMNMMSHGMQLPPDVIFEFMNIPNKEEMLNKVKEWQTQQAQIAAAAGQTKGAVK